MDNYQGFNSFEEMMSERTSSYSTAKTSLDIRNEIEQLLTKLDFSRTKYTAIFAEWTNQDGYAVRLYSKGQIYEIYLPDKERHSKGSYNKILELLEKRIDEK